MSIDRRDFLKVATAGAGLAITGNRTAAAEEAGARRAPFVRSGQVADAVVIGAGNFGAWTALNLQRGGMRVTLLDQYGPGNSRSTSGGETRGVRSSYGDRPQGLQWGQWAIRSMRLWKEWDAEHADGLLPPLFYETGDVIMRDEMSPFMQQSCENWDVLGHPYEILTPDEVRYRWPVIHTPEIEAAVYEPSAGVVRARRAIESVAQVFQQEGGEIRIARASIGDADGRTLANLRLDGGDRLEAGLFVIAVGPWFAKFLPELMTRRFNSQAMGYVYYFATPPGDESYRWPNVPSYNVPGVTGWPALPRDSRGFRVRTGGTRGDDPDTSIRTIPPDAHERPRDVLRAYFPALADNPINETRACHYSSVVSRNFLIDRHPDYDNAWLAGGGSAESFKQGPVLGQYISGRILGTENDEELNASFRLVEEEFPEDGGDGRGRGRGRGRSGGPRG